jgi:arginine exporter protein ArgO
LDIHRKLGIAGAALATIMVVLGPATALVVDAGRFTAAGTTPEFLAVQLSDIVAFAGFTAAGLLLRARPATHKRLMLLGLIYISDAGFARLLNGAIAAPLALGPEGSASS